MPKYSTSRAFERNGAVSFMGHSSPFCTVQSCMASWLPCSFYCLLHSYCRALILEKINLYSLLCRGILNKQTNKKTLPFSTTTVLYFVPSPPWWNIVWKVLIKQVKPGHLFQTKVVLLESVWVVSLAVQPGAVAGYHFCVLFIRWGRLL